MQRVYIWNASTACIAEKELNNTFCSTVPAAHGKYLYLQFNAREMESSIFGIQCKK